MSAFTRRTLLAATLAAPLAPRAQTRQLRIGFQKGSISLVLLKQRGVLEAKLPGTAVSWIEFPAGPQLLEALAVGSVDLGATGDSPPVFAQAAGKDLRYVGAEPPKPDTSALLVHDDAPLRSLADLKGRRVALQKGSSAHFLTVRALAKAGLQFGDIQPSYLPPAEARAAFQRRSIDAWAIWDPYYAAAEIDGGARVLATSRGLTNNNTFYLSSSAFAAAHPQALHAAFDALTEQDAWQRANRKEAAQRYADFSGLGLATVHRVLERRPPSPVGPITPQLLAEQQLVADAFFKLQLIPKAISVADIAWRPTLKSL